MARWRKQAEPVVPAWVLDDIDAPEADAWLDALYDEDPERWYEALVVIISTPSYRETSIQMHIFTTDGTYSSSDSR